MEAEIAVLTSADETRKRCRTEDEEVDTLLSSCIRYPYREVSRARQRRLTTQDGSPLDSKLVEEAEKRKNPRCCCPPAPASGGCKPGRLRAGALLLAEGSGTGWNPVLPALKAEHIDALLSSTAQGTASVSGVQSLEAEARAAAEQLGEGTPLHVVALGKAAPIALQLSALLPGVVKKLVIVCGDFSQPQGQGNGRSLQGIDKSQAQRFSPGNDYRTAKASSSTVAGTASVLEDKFLLSQVTQPTLCLSCEDDVQQASTLMLASRLDDCRYFDLGPKAYPVVQSDPKTLVQALVDFFREDLVQSYVP